MATGHAIIAEREPEPTAWADFLTIVPPPAIRVVSGAIELQPAISSWSVRAPVLKLYCSECDAEMNFDGGSDGLWRGPDQRGQVLGYLAYLCRHCKLTSRTYALWVSPKDRTAEKAEAWKIGEIPFYAPHVPKRLLDVIGDREMFFNGRRAEASGLGIGAFVYYRRVVEDQKNRLLDEILKVAERTGAKPEVVAALKAARAERDFSRSVDLMKDAIPEQLRYDSHNPMMLLNSALGHDIHSSTDAECLEFARGIRLVLGFIAEKTAEVLRDRKELHEAVAQLQRKHEEKQKREKP